MRPVLVFDVVGTLLDLASLDLLFEKYFGNRELRKQWFSEVLKLALATTVISNYAGFSRITEAALKVIEIRHSKELKPEASEAILSALRKLPPFPDVKPALERLRKEGFRLAALTNSGATAATQALQSAEIAGLFERILSADSVKRLKPAAEPYQMAARDLGVEIGSLMMVAAHSWDIAGAAAAGCQTAFIQRPGQVLDALTPAPLIVATDLQDLMRKVSHFKAA